MTELAVIQEGTPSALLDRWHRLKAQQPSLRIRDAADRLGVSEAEIIAARCGDGVQRLAGPWGDLIEALPSLGSVMALTRNEHVVHEKTGSYGNIKISKSMGLVLNKKIDLRIFLDKWCSGYAVAEKMETGMRRSLQFFDECGTAIHKIYLAEGSDGDEYLTLVERFLDADQAPGQAVSEPMARKPDHPDEKIDQAKLRQRWLALRDVHDFMGLLKKLEVGRVQALRLIGEDMAFRVQPNSFQKALERASRSALPIMIFVGSPGVVQIHSGPVQSLKKTGPWFNVLDAGFNLHLRTDRIASAWVVRKPTRDGIITSLEIFDADNQQIALMFGVRIEGEREREDWRALTETLERVPS